MLEISVDGLFDSSTNEFLPDKVYTFEHSLLSISKWESVFKKPFPFLSGLQAEPIELLAYIPMMNLDDEFDIDDLSSKNIEDIFKYLNERPTATTITNTDGESGKRILTSEVIYAYMATGQVPFSCETWNIHRLLTLLGVIGELNNPKKKKRSAQDTARMYQEINAKRRAQMQSEG